MIRTKMGREEKTSVALTKIERSINTVAELSRLQMNALVFHGAGNRAWESVPKPTLKSATDAIVAIEYTTICGTDLHIMKGDLPEVTAGRVLGHEGVGRITKTGSAVTDFKVGDRVLISCITSCGKCRSCRTGMFSHCESGGWLLGNQIDGTQAEFVRIPFADTSLYHLSEEADGETSVLLSDILPTGYECGVLSGTVKPGDVVAIVGAGPIGLATLLTTQLYSPSEIIMIDHDINRLKVAQTLGATTTIQNDHEDAVADVMIHTNGRGVDVAIEAVGLAATFDICQAIVAVGGHIANVGVHGTSVQLHIEKLWSRNISLTTRLVDTTTIPLLMRLVESKKLRPEKLVSHRFSLMDIMHAYDVYGNASKEKALKIILKNRVLV